MIIFFNIKRIDASEIFCCIVFLTCINKRKKSLDNDGSIVGNSFPFPVFIRIKDKLLLYNEPNYLWPKIFSLPSLIVILLIPFGYIFSGFFSQFKCRIFFYFHSWVCNFHTLQLLIGNFYFYFIYIDLIKRVYRWIYGSCF